jgi:methylglutamate dehydrogenase subunit C
MATDQGKTGNLGGLAVMAELTGAKHPRDGYHHLPPALYARRHGGALAGRSQGREFKPFRLTPSHKWAHRTGRGLCRGRHVAARAMVPPPGRNPLAPVVDREVLQTRKSVGICDVTTLGKIDIQGTDAGEFLNRVYANTFATLPVGKCRYGLMLREDGVVHDDGTTARMGENEYVMTTTTANAVGVFRHLEYCRQCLWPDMDVQIISTTEAWAQFSVAGPNARKLLEKIVDQDISDAAFPYMACGQCHRLRRLRARLFRISFSGELAYEIAVPTRYGDALIRRLVAEGEEFDAVVYGTEALGVMRVEKGHVAGNELNGQTTALNMGLGKMVSTAKDSIGAVLSRRDGLAAPEGLELVGLRPVNPQSQIPAGAHLLAPGAALVAANDLGHVTASCYSPNLGSYIALGFVKNGAARMGEMLRAASPLTGVDLEVQITSPHFYDPEGERLRA